MPFSAQLGSVCRQPFRCVTMAVSSLHSLSESAPCDCQNTPLLVLGARSQASSQYPKGGVLSPILFTIYLDDLLLELERAGVGCYWRHHFVGAVCYADDIALIAPSLSALQIMLDTCIHYASSHSLTFNPSKNATH